MSRLRFALKPLRQFADFHGRSTRTELVAFYIMSQLLALAANLASMFAGFSGFWAGDLVNLVLICPTLALWVRRLHDTGRNGWWVLLALPALPASLWHRYVLWQDPLAFAELRLPWFIEASGALLLLSLFALLLWDDEELPNFYGPNPRYDAEDPLENQPGELA